MHFKQSVSVYHTHCHTAGNKAEPHVSMATPSTIMFCMVHSNLDTTSCFDGNLWAAKQLIYKYMHVATKCAGNPGFTKVVVSVQKHDSTEQKSLKTLF